MPALRIRALQMLAAHIEAQVPSLANRTCAGAAAAPKAMAFPSLAIYGVRFTYQPDQPELHSVVSASRAVFNVGRIEGTVQLRLGAQTPQRRYQLEQEILEKVFLADLGHPGIALFTVGDVYDARIAFEMGDDEWQDERAFDKKWYSFLTCDLQMPALALHDVPTIESLDVILADPDELVPRAFDAGLGFGLASFGEGSFGA